jgi:hypothetical protein
VSPKIKPPDSIALKKLTFPAIAILPKPGASLSGTALATLFIKKRPKGPLVGIKG